jgi:hypothetical protein
VTSVIYEHQLTSRLCRGAIAAKTLSNFKKEGAAALIRVPLEDACVADGWGTGCVIDATHVGLTV